MADTKSGISPAAPGRGQLVAQAAARLLNELDDSTYRMGGLFCHQPSLLGEK